MEFWKGMMETLNSAVARLQNAWTEASSLHRAILTVGGLIVLAALSYAITAEPDHDLIPLAEQPLSFKRVGQITTELDKRGIPYKVADSATQVLVPRPRRGDLLASLASAGISTQPDAIEPVPSNLLATDFQQREQVRHALERSLARDISSMTAIEWAEVHISPGNDSVFSRAKRKGAASVVVKIRAGFSFGKERASSLKTLVSQAAYRYGVSSDSVTVIDHEARTLAPAEDDSDLGLNTKALALQRETEDDLADRIRLLLEPVVGLGRVRVQVRTKMNLNRVEERAEQYDPDNSTVLSELKTTEAARQLREEPVTAAGAAGNLPQFQVESTTRGRSRSNQDRAVAETKFAVPKVVRLTKRAIGEIERMSVAVLVDSTAFSKPEQQPEQPKRPEVVPHPQKGSDADGRGTGAVSDDPRSERPSRPNRDMLLALVRDAVAFDAARGDTVTLSFQPFLRTPIAPHRAPVEAPHRAMPTWLPITAVTFVGFVCIGIALLLSERRRLRSVAPTAGTDPQSQPAEAIATETDPTVLGLKDQVRVLTSANVGTTADVIKGWLSPSLEKN